jgi:Asp-tRNA(Asn)/Glu-tRNA(Gln) amidotransferase A subunit family amidase
VDPIAASVGDVALLLSVVAGEDGLDHRQNGARFTDYLADLDGASRV